MISGVYAIVAAVSQCRAFVVLCYLLTHRGSQVYANYVHASPLASDRSLHTQNDTRVVRDCKPQTRETTVYYAAA